MTCSPDEYMREALRLFLSDPPVTDFQKGYLAGLKVFAREALDFKSDDPLLLGDELQA